MTSDELKQEAERRLQALGLNIVTAEQMAQWNEEKNAAMMFERDMQPQDWVEIDGFLTKEFYVHTEPGVGEFAIYRKAWFHDYSGNGDYEFLLTDHAGNELVLPAPAQQPAPAKSP